METDFGKTQKWLLGFLLPAIAAHFLASDGWLKWLTLSIAAALLAMFVAKLMWPTIRRSGPGARGALLFEVGRRRGNKAKLLRGVIDLYKSVPHPLARWLTEEILEGPSETINKVSRKADSLRHGLDRYQDFIHKQLKKEKKSGTKVLATCGEKGLKSIEAARHYFDKFYWFAQQNPKNEVYRVFVTDGKGIHSPVTRAIMKDHNANEVHGVHALEVSVAGRNILTDQSRRICDELQKGFGLVFFARKSGDDFVVVHGGHDKWLSFAEFDDTTPEVLISLIRLTKDLYKGSREYQEFVTHHRRAKQAQIDALFSWVETSGIRP